MKTILTADAGRLVGRCDASAVENAALISAVRIENNNTKRA